MPGAYFGVDVGAMVERVLAGRLADGGWKYEAENGSVRSSFDTTINVFDGLLQFERAIGGPAQVPSGRRSDEEYLLERGLFRRKSTGAIVQAHAQRRQQAGVLAVVRQDLELGQGRLERAAVWLEAGQKRLPEEV